MSSSSISSILIDLETDASKIGTAVLRDSQEDGSKVVSEDQEKRLLRRDSMTT